MLSRRRRLIQRCVRIIGGGGNRTPVRSAKCQENRVEFNPGGAPGGAPALSEALRGIADRLDAGEDARLNQLVSRIIALMDEVGVKL